MIGIGVGVCTGAAITYLLDAIFGVTPGAISYAATTGLLTASKRRVFRANFKRKIIENIVKRHGLSYDKDRGLELDEFLCRVDEWSSEDLVEAI